MAARVSSSSSSRMGTGGLNLEFVHLRHGPIINLVDVGRNELWSAADQNCEHGKFRSSMSRCSDNHGCFALTFALLSPHRGFAPEQRASRPHRLGCAGGRRLVLRAKAAPAAAAGVHRAEQGQGKSRGRHRGRQVARRGARPRAALRTAGAGQDDAGQHHRQRARRRPSSRPPARRCRSRAT